MKGVIRIQTHDGAVHESQRDAVKHLDKMYGDVMLPLAKRITHAEKYHKIAEILDAETETFRAMIRIKDDLHMEKDSTQDEE